MKAQRIEKYLRRYGISKTRPLIASSVEGIEQVVVIPVLAEKSSLFRTLSSIAQNPPRDLRSTLVICVVNNYQPRLTTKEEITDNQETIHLLESLVFERNRISAYPGDLKNDLQQVGDSDLRLAFVDASSPGRELLERCGGVGTARKIGMDAALGLIGADAGRTGVICCLDADTLVQTNYLMTIRTHFTRRADAAAVTAYAHQKPDDPELLAAICCYEIFLRAYVIGLSYGSSPYAFHTIGSTIACTTDGYAGVRGVNRRTAAEDFYFLNKIAKTGSVGVITETTVFPSPRPSRRVPFGTGQRIRRFMTGGNDEYRLYDPRIFILLKKWLSAMEATPDRDSETLLSEARRIHVCLEQYLRQIHFDRDWDLIRKNCRDACHLRHQFHVWYDALKTLKMIRHLSRSAFPLVPMFDGLAALMDLTGMQIPLVRSPAGIPGLDDQYRILEALRSHFPSS